MTRECSVYKLRQGVALTRADTREGDQQGQEALLLEATGRCIVVHPKGRGERKHEEVESGNVHEARLLPQAAELIPRARPGAANSVQQPAGGQ